MSYPLGKNEEGSAYKGFGLAIAVEILTSILAGARLSKDIPKWNEAKEPLDISHGFFIIDPKQISKNFKQRLSTLILYLRQLEPVNIR